MEKFYILLIVSSITFVILLSLTSLYYRKQYNKAIKSVIEYKSLSTEGLEKIRVLHDEKIIFTAKLEDKDKFIKFLEEEVKQKDELLKLPDIYNEAIYSLEETCSKSDLKEFGREVIIEQMKESIKQDILSNLEELIEIKEEVDFGITTILGEFKFYYKENDFIDGILTTQRSFEITNN